MSIMLLASEMNAESPRIPRRDKEAFLSEQCLKKKKENNRMGKTRDLFKKVGSYQGNISCKDRDVKGQKQ